MDKKKHLLIVDDELLIRDLLYDHFSDCDYEITLADNGQTALAHLDQKTFDTLLAYNGQDTITLENLTRATYNLKLRGTPFHNNLLIKDSTPPVNPLSADLATIDRIKSNSQYWASGQWY